MNALGLIFVALCEVAGLAWLHLARQHLRSATEPSTRITTSP